jgi:hypothetical protein
VQRTTLLAYEVKSRITGRMPVKLNSNLEKYGIATKGQSFSNLF